MPSFPFPIFFVLALCVVCAQQVAYSQKSSNSKQDERNENARVAKAERSLADARKDFAEIQQQLKKENATLEKSTQSIPPLKKKLRGFREDAEDRLGAKVGIPEALAKVRKASAELELVSSKIREQVHQTPEWLKASLAAKEAKEKKAALLDEMVDEDVEPQLIAGLSKIATKPLELEEEAIAKDSIAIEATAKLKVELTELDKKRKLLPEGEVDRDPKVVKVVGELQKLERSIAEQEDKLRKTRTEAIKIQKRVVVANTELQRAKSADAADPNRPPKNNKK